ncbi:MAG: nucleotidyl transferase AbiEii/AbiGii toxin family protein [Planctomycetes bacterium]|nr:nucleotidyl transferase AbiEii/AbiGii toxin family protein [Planctomycetota bacterium]
MERLLYRLASSKHASRFVLKGALMFRVWNAPATRPTRDIDLLGRMDSKVTAVVPVFKDVCNQPVEPDGLIFHADSVAGQAIKEDADYAGVRVTLRATLHNSRIAMQIDIGFGDVLTPAAVAADYPTILDLPAPRLKGYSRETVVAEKFEAMVKLGLVNSRMKDFYDIWLLSQHFDFDGSVLSNAITRTLAHRKTQILAAPTALTPVFGDDGQKQTQWRAFLRKTRLTDAPTALPDVIAVLAPFLLPMAQAIVDGQAFNHTRKARGPWK